MEDNQALDALRFNPTVFRSSIVGPGGFHHKVCFIAASEYVTSPAVPIFCLTDDQAAILYRELSAYFSRFDIPEVQP